MLTYTYFDHWSLVTKFRLRKKFTSKIFYRLKYPNLRYFKLAHKHHKSCVLFRQVTCTRTKSKSGAVVKIKRIFVVYETALNIKGLFKSGAPPLDHLLVTSLLWQTICFLLMYTIFLVYSTLLKVVTCTHMHNIIAAVYVVQCIWSTEL